MKRKDAMPLIEKRIARATTTDPATPSQLEIDIDKDAGIRLFGTGSRDSCQRLARLFGEVWKGIPKDDCKWMQLHWKNVNLDDRQCLLEVNYHPGPLAAR